jgi:hypothetical protein
VRLEQQRQEHEGSRGHGPFQYRHLEHQAADPFRCPRRGEQAHVGAQRHPAQDGLVHPELIHQAQHLLGVQVHPVRAGVPRFVAVAVAQQVQQHDPVAQGGQRPGQGPAQAGVQQQAVQPYQHALTRAVDLVMEPVSAVGQRVHAARGIRSGLPGVAGPDVLKTMTFGPIDWHSTSMILRVRG